MKIYRVHFYEVSVSKSDNRTQKYLGFQDVIDNKLSDGCSFLAKAFRSAIGTQKTANAYVVENL